MSVKRDRGFTTIELLTTVLMMLAFGGTAILALSKFIATARVSEAANQLADRISIARARAVGESANWRVRFELDGQAMAQSLVLESQQVDWSCSPGPCPSQAWTQQAAYSLYVAYDKNGKDTGIRINVPVRASPPVGEPLSQPLVFDYTGTLADPAGLTEVRVCAVDRGGACISGQTMVLTVQPFSGVISMTKE